MKKSFSVLFFCFVFCGNLFAQNIDNYLRDINKEIEQLQIQKNQKLNELKDCEKSVKGFKIAGISTLSATAVLGGVNVYLAVKRADTQEDVKQYLKNNGLNDRDEFVFAQNEQIELEKEFEQQLIIENESNDEEIIEIIVPIKEVKIESKKDENANRKTNEESEQIILQIVAEFRQVGTASWYGGFFHGRKTASGEVFNKQYYSCAHRTLKLKSVVKITNTENGRFMFVRVNDRGPYKDNRIVDVSEITAVALGFKNKGLANVIVEQ